MYIALVARERYAISIIVERGQEDSAPAILRIEYNRTLLHT